MENKRLTKDNYTDDLFEKQKELIKIDEYHEIHYSQANYNEDLWNAVKEKEDLEEQIGCPLEVRCKVVPNSYIYTYETSMEAQDIIAKRKVSNISKEEIYISYTTASGRKRDMTLSWKSYKTLWWLKKNREE